MINMGIESSKKVNSENEKELEAEGIHNRDEHANYKKNKESLFIIIIKK